MIGDIHTLSQSTNQSANNPGPEEDKFSITIPGLTPALITGSAKCVVRVLKCSPMQKHVTTFFH